MDLLEELNAIWVDILCSFFMLSYLIFVGVLIYQHYRNKREQEAILAQYKRNLEILRDLKNRF